MYNRFGIHTNPNIRYYNDFCIHFCIHRFSGLESGGLEFNATKLGNFIFDYYRKAKSRMPWHKRTGVGFKEFCVVTHDIVSAWHLGFFRKFILS